MTITTSPPSDPPALERIPPLENGDRLTRAEFERRYAAMPHGKKAELIEGVVYMPSPVCHADHSGPHFDIIAWLGLYRIATPEILGGDNGTLRLDLDNEPQPDAYLMIKPGLGGQADIDSDGYVSGAPELVVEVAASSVSYDLNAKLHVYRPNGVKEYVVWRVLDRAVDWFALREGRYEPVPVGPDGIYRSEVLPGLWLDPRALVEGDLETVARLAREGMATPEHAAFRTRLRGAGSPADRRESSG